MLHTVAKFHCAILHTRLNSSGTGLFLSVVMVFPGSIGEHW